MISVTILTKDSEKYLHQVLDALKQFSEVLIVDTGSKDSTVDIAKSFPNVTFFERPFIGFGPTHNLASNLAKNDWILSIDSDEIMSDALTQEILALQLDPSCVYSFCRDNYYRGRLIHGCGWYPDRVVRLYNRKVTRFSDALVHESIVMDRVQEVRLSFTARHYPYDSVKAFLAKLQSYTDLYAEENHGKKANICTAVAHALFAFFRAYILKRGFLLGREGLEISWYIMNCAFYKYAKLRD
jgi:glycosyltransferase involved in cell wall biosynthesis